MEEIITKLNDTTYEESVTVQTINEIKVERTLDDLLADIAGTEVWLAKAQQEVVDATTQLQALLNKKSIIEGLGIVTLETKRETKEEKDDTKKNKLLY